ncbi:MAG: carboxylesterase [Oligoflexia bacterium]|nr:MAG: carboxylesterase [Oligoflexia bacterium]
MIKTDLFQSHFIPSEKPTDKLMIVLHGKGDSLKPFKDFHNEMQFKDVNYLLLNAPKKFDDGYSWYGEPPYQRDGVRRIREKMFQLLSDLENQGWKPENIFLFGFSQGCLVSTDLALHYPRRFGGVVGVSGYFQFFPRWKKQIHPRANQTPWLLTHGTKDDVLPLEDTKYGVEKLRKIGLQIDWVEFNKEHTLEDEEYPIIRQWVREKLKEL